MRLCIDCETYSEADLPSVGADAYARHPSTEVLLWSVIEPSWPRSLVFEGWHLWAILRELKSTGQIHWTRNDPLEIVTWGAFDRLIVEHAEPWTSEAPPDREWGWNEVTPSGWLRGPGHTLWLDLRAVSLSYGAPAALGAAAAFWGAPEAKDTGKHLIARFCRPQKRSGARIVPSDDPVRWEQFRSYAGQDTNVMVPILQQIETLEGGHSWAQHAAGWQAVERMNRRGIAVDLAAVRAAQAACTELEAGLAERCLSEFGFRPSQTEAVREFLGLPDVQRETLLAYLETTPEGSPEAQVAEIRLEVSGAARKKLAAMDAQQTGARVRGGFTYHGAWTRRLTAQGIQPQNFVRGRADPAFFESLEKGDIEGEGFFRAVRDNIRGFLAPPDGDCLVAADYNAIELRVGAWLADETWVLDALREGRDVYCLTADAIYGQPEGTVRKGDPRREFGKVVELAALYQLGGRGLHRQTQQRKLEVSPAAAEQVIAIYRQKHPAIVRTWGQCQAVFERLMTEGGTGRAAGCRFEGYPNHIKVIRPSGFAQYYWLPRFTEGRWPDGNPKQDISYVGRGRTGRMELKQTYGGDIFQGIVQGTAADLMLHALDTVERHGFYPTLSVHDEIVCELASDGQQYVDRLCQLLCRLPRWAHGLPVRAEGWQGPRFTK